MKERKQVREKGKDQEGIRKERKQNDNSGKNEGAATGEQDVVGR